MSSDGQALFRAVCEQPWEDTPRLVYADWLEENGNPVRAEFIRVQVALAQLPPAEQWLHPLAARAAELRKQGDPGKGEVKAGRGKRVKRWSKDLPVLEGVEWTAGYHRGFRNGVVFASMHTVLTFEEMVTAAAPVDWVQVKGLRPFMVEALLTRPWVRRLAGLSLWGEVGTSGMEALARTDALGRLERLDLSVARPTDAGVQALATATSLTNLRRLELEINTGGLTVNGLADLINAPALPRLAAVDGIDWPLLWRARGTDLQERFYQRFPETYRR
ncbi:TIGR02996 domain-containing protein [Gemmata sp. JC673]|uniref:TIGR02996 domain-containing protein n=1 Tax=Gemmata algarum TaxID=2975278 RepID=A0ABU5EX59_9BACT|nr:TIGR02996 domain-containing protein [Gemmata algarum]MDY3558296.1 TIGR02996 domain-containing protein [Gemmata algarum]